MPGGGVRGSPVACPVCGPVCGAALCHWPRHYIHALLSLSTASVVKRHTCMSVCVQEEREAAYVDMEKATEEKDAGNTGGLRIYIHTSVYTHLYVTVRVWVNSRVASKYSAIDCPATRTWRK